MASASTNKRGKKTTATTKKKKTSQAKPRRREIGALVCLILGLFSFLGYFQLHAIFIDFFCGLVKGLIGWGFYLLPPMLLVAAGILITHRGRPVRFRVTSALLFAVIMGSVLHLFLCKLEIPWNWDMFGTLYNSGRDLLSGGAISGLLCMAFSALFSKIGAGIVLIFGALFFLLAAFNRSIPGLIAGLREKAKNREHLEYELEPEPEPVQRPRTHTPAAAPVQPGRGRSAIDIPVDDPPRAKPEKEKKPSFFKKTPNVATPDAVLMGTASAPPEPAAHSEIHTEPAQPAPAPVAQEAPSAAAPVTGTSPAPDAAAKMKPEELQQAAAEVTQTIEKNLESSGEVYQFPPLDLLNAGGNRPQGDSRAEMQQNAARLQATIESFGIKATMHDVTRGPSVTRYEVELDRGVKLNKLTNLADDIALALGATGIRIAPIPDKISIVGIEVPNKLVSTVFLRELIASPEFKNAKSKLSFAVGRDIGGNCIVGDISKLPHLLIAGTTGSGKSVCMNSLIISLLYKSTPEEVRLIMVDPKMIELGVYNGIPHLLIPVVTDPKKAAGALQWAVTEMMKRYKLFSEVGAKNISTYNAACEKDPERQKLPQVVILIDELADLMLVAAKEVEESICRIAQMARAAGMHLIIATQRPSADVITGLMKANIPSRIAFAVASQLESRIILDTQGAEKLVGRGDMLYFPLGAGKPMRVQGTFVDEDEVERVVEFVKSKGQAQYSEDVISQIEKHAAEKTSGQAKGAASDGAAAEQEGDELFPAAVEVVLESGQASVSMLQRRLKLGYSRAARLVDQMEERGIVGPFEGSKPRQLLITKEQWQEMQFIQGTAPVDTLAEDVPEEADE